MIIVGKKWKPRRLVYPFFRSKFRKILNIKKKLQDCVKAVQSFARLCNVAVKIRKNTRGKRKKGTHLNFAIILKKNYWGIRKKLVFALIKANKLGLSRPQIRKNTPENFRKSLFPAMLSFMAP